MVWVVSIFAMICSFAGCGGGKSSLSIHENGTGVTNHSPIISSLSISSAVVAPGEKVVISVNAYDPDNDPIDYQWLATGGQLQGTGAQVAWQAPQSSGIYTITVIVRDNKGLQASQSAQVEVRTDSSSTNQVPTVSLNADATIVKPNETTTIRADASDPDNDPLTYAWQATGGTLSSDNASQIMWTAPASEGTYTITCVVTDSKGGQASASITIIVRQANRPPQIQELTATPKQVEPTDTTQLKCEAVDPDDDKLTYTWSVKPSAGNFQGSGNQVVWQAPPQEGDFTIQCVVSDGVAVDSKSVVVKVRDQTPPIITTVDVAPTALPVRGGDVTISATVKDISGVDKVVALITKPSGAVDTVTLAIVGDDNYTATYHAPPNVRTDGQAEEYIVRIRATDIKGNQTPSPGEPAGGVKFIVNPAIPPPQPPSSH